MTPATRKRLYDSKDEWWVRFERRVRRPRENGCWLWTGAVTGTPPWQYGAIGSGPGKTTWPGVGNEYRAHRVAWVLYRGPIPEGLWVLHTCDEPRCVRPDHLFLGTAADNITDMIRKSRQGWRRKASA